MNKADIESALREVEDENMGADLMSAGLVKDISIEGERVSISLVLGYPAAGYFDELKKMVREKHSSLDGVGEVEVEGLSDGPDGASIELSHQRHDGRAQRGVIVEVGLRDRVQLELPRALWPRR